MDDLQILKRAALPPALDALDDSVFDALAARRRDAAALRRSLALAVLVSLGSGVVAGALTPTPVAANPLTPFIPADPLTPSTLLDLR